jgi:Tol biopolymer transport system component
VTDVLASVLKETPDLGAIPDDTPERLRQLVARCLEKDPRRRLQAIGEARIVLEGPLEEPHADATTAVEPAPPSRTLRVWQAVTLALLLSAAALAWLALRPTADVRQVIRADIPAPEGTAFDLDPGGPGAVSVSPDGTQMVFSARDEAGQILLWVRRLSDNGARPLPGTEDGAYPFWSPDGRSIAFFSGDAKLRRVDVAGGPPVTVCPAPNGKGGSWSDDGRILFTPAHNTPIQVVDAAGGEPRDVTELREGETGHRFPTWLSGGRFLYLARARAGEDEDRVRVGSVDGSVEDGELLAAASNVVPASDRLLFLREGNLMAQPFNIDAAELTGDAVPIADDVLYISGARLGVFSASRNGVLVYQGGSVDTETQLVWFDRAGEELDQLGDGVRHRDIQLSPDGRLAAAEILDDQSGASDIWVYDLARRLRTRFTFDPTMDWWPVWSPDGSRLAFSSIRDGSNNLWIKDVGGADEEQLLFRDEEAELGAAAWSPDGRHLVFARFNIQDWDIFALELETGEATAVIASSFREWQPELSPDGRWIAFASTESGRSEVYVTTFPAPGRRWQVSTAGGEFPRWSGDGRELFFVAPDGNLTVAEIDGRSDTLVVGRLESLFTWPRASGFRFPYAVSPDADRFLVNRAVSSDQSFPLTLVYNWDAELEAR